MGLAVESRGIGQRRDVLANRVRVTVVDLELNPIGFVRQVTQFTHQTKKIVMISVAVHGKRFQSK